MYREDSEHLTFQTTSAVYRSTNPTSLTITLTADTGLVPFPGHMECAGQGCFDGGGRRCVRGGLEPQPRALRRAGTQRRGRGRPRVSSGSSGGAATRRRSRAGGAPRVYLAGPSAAAAAATPLRGRAADQYGARRGGGGSRWRHWRPPPRPPPAPARDGRRAPAPLRRAAPQSAASSSYEGNVWKLVPP